MSWSTYTREARTELQRLYLGALTASVESQVERHRESRHRVRLRRAERRLAELRRLSSVEDPVETAAAAARPVTALTTVTAAWLASGAILAVCVVMNLEAAVTGLADLVLLALTLVWFMLAVACSPKT
jgi:Flp pilus assembly protein TadB